MNHDSCCIASDGIPFNHDFNNIQKWELKIGMPQARFCLLDKKGLGHSVVACSETFPSKQHTAETPKRSCHVV
jgi:hypothetical protein